jgi:hypothetical protein
VWILDGTYTLSECSDAAKCASTLVKGSAHDIGLAVTPAAPRDVKASSTSGAVTVTWSPSANPEPDLLGYAVARDGKVVYACSTDGAGPGAGTPCSTPLSAVDDPATGTWSYTVSALRFGISPAASDVVVSPASPAASVEAVAPAGYSSDGASNTGGGLNLPPVVGVNTAVTVPPVLPVATSATTLDGASPGVAALPSNLSYGDDPVVRDPSGVSTAAKENGPSTKPDAVPLGLLALALLALALAAHVYYLRAELEVADARANLVRIGRQAQADPA